MKKGRILLFNGTSSAGKTTLAWEMQTYAPSYWYWLPVDHFLDVVPVQQWDNDENEEGYRFAVDLYHDCIKEVCDQGKDVIADTVICDEYTLSSFTKRLKPYNVILVKVTCPVEELNKREAARGDRDIGLAASQINTLVPHEYDLTVDTYAQFTKECFNQILGLLDKPEECTAFKKLTEKSED